MAKFRLKKPLLVNAVQWNGDNFEEIAALVGERLVKKSNDKSRIFIRLNNGSIYQIPYEIPVGYWVTVSCEFISEFGMMAEDLFKDRHQEILQAE